MGLTKVIPIQDATREVNRIFGALDVDNGGFIEFQEFLMATVNTKDILSSNNLKMCFNSFDEDKSGWISIAELKESLAGKLDDTDWHELLVDLKPNEEGELNFEEFEKMMKKMLKEKIPDKNFE